MQANNEIAFSSSSFNRSYVHIKINKTNKEEPSAVSS